MYTTEIENFGKPVRIEVGRYCSALSMLMIKKCTNREWSKDHQPREYLDRADMLQYQLAAFIHSVEGLELPDCYDAALGNEQRMKNLVEKANVLLSFFDNKAMDKVSDMIHKDGEELEEIEKK